MTDTTAPLCLLALPSYRERTERSPRTGLAYTVGGWRWPGLPWPRNRAGLGSGAVIWHDDDLLVSRHGREGPP